MEVKNNEYQTYRKAVFEIYEKVLKDTHRKEYAYEEAKLYIEKQVGKNNHYRYYRGLLAELLFYHLNRDSMQLEITSPELDMHYKADFIGVDPLTGDRIMIDVTSDLRSKFKRDISDWIEISKNAKSKGYEYRLAPILPQNDHEPIDKYIENYPVPYLIPINEKGNPGLPLLVLERENDSPFKAGYYNLLGSPYIIFFDNLKKPSNVVDATAISKQFIIYGALPIEELGEYTSNQILRDRFKIVTTARELLGVYFSASLEDKYLIVNPMNGDGYYGKIITWMHPLMVQYGYLGALFDEFPWNSYVLWW